MKTQKNILLFLVSFCLLISLGSSFSASAADSEIINNCFRLNLPSDYKADSQSAGLYYGPDNSKLTVICLQNSFLIHLPEITAEECTQFLYPFNDMLGINA